MTQYALQHPVLTFFIVCLALIVIDNLVGNIGRVLIFKIGKKKESEDDGFRKKG